MASNSPHAHLPVLAAWQRQQVGLARTLHDTVAQSLGSAAMICRVLVRRLEAGGTVSVEEMQSLEGMLQRGCAETQHMHSGVQAFADTPTALFDALERLVDELSAASPCRLVCPEPVFLPVSAQSAAHYVLLREVAVAALAAPPPATRELELQREGEQLAWAVRSPAGFRPIAWPVLEAYAASLEIELSRHWKGETLVAVSGAARIWVPSEEPSGGQTMIPCEILE